MTSYNVTKIKSAKYNNALWNKVIIRSMFELKLGRISLKSTKLNCKQIGFCKYHRINLMQ